MTTIYIDFETYYDKDYSLSKMSTEEYIRDARFKVHGFAYCAGDGLVRWVPGPSVSNALLQLAEEFPDASWCAHNAMFDMAVLSWHYNVRPRRIVDTLSMARLADVHGKHSLAALSERYNLGMKGDALVKTLGVRDLNPMLETRLAEYCRQDVALLRKLHHALDATLRSELPEIRYKRELALIDCTVRMFTEPVLTIDAALLQARLAELEAQRDAAVAASGVSLDVLMSNPQFAAVLASRGVQVPASLRKTDPDLLALKDDPRAATLIQGRLAAKSVSELRRTAKFLGVSGRGSMPVPLKYHGAHTGRWSGADGLNMQNLNRGSALRKCLTAPDGYVLVVVDSSQIEARVLAWLAGQDDLLAMFAAGEDVYVKFAERIWPGEKIDEVKRFVGKTCLAADTKVLTDKGWKPIVQVSVTDLVWDGESWVKHNGLQFQGYKPTLRRFGIAATEDHEILTGLGWREWSEVQSNRGLFQSALNLASLPCSDLSRIGRALGARQGGNLFAGVHAGGKVLLAAKTFLQGVQRAAMRVQKSLRGRNDGGNIKPRFQTTRIGRGYLADCRRALVDATTRRTQHSPVMAGGAFTLIQHGARIAQRFSGTFRLCLDGTTQRLSLTGSTLTVPMRQGTSGSLLGKKTLRTEGRQTIYHKESSPSKENLPVYDLLNCGPNNRFMVMTNQGPIIVHNCILGLGYGVGHTKLHAQIVTKQPDAALEDAQQYVATYRNTYGAITRLWKRADGMLRAMMQDARVGWVCGIATEFEKLRLPSGRVLRYPGLRLTPDGYEYGVGSNKRRLYGAALVENIVQAIARDIVADQMLAVRSRYRVVTMTHDEIVFLVREGEASEAFEFAKSVMRAAPSYAEGVPLNCAGGYARNYSK
jgi:DNA polymerase I-like protein with 3'-5' exonuclease and polymerase domains